MGDYVFLPGARPSPCPAAAAVSPIPLQAVDEAAEAGVRLLRAFEFYELADAAKVGISILWIKVDSSVEFSCNYLNL